MSAETTIAIVALVLSILAPFVGGVAAYAAFHVLTNWRLVALETQGAKHDKMLHRIDKTVALIAARMNIDTSEVDAEGQG